ncbi:MAG: alcohol dehydrogenase catalytic domain-containing protein [Lachnospiraceae bacterium]|jgi:threonine dehydrogenase-like Zn-dependent dehydrogenase|nr:alcohol dehydrogenase catalytic domain-containing protein [Lachnospiraceae bacterium]
MNTALLKEREVMVKVRSRVSEKELAYGFSGVVTASCTGLDEALVGKRVAVITYRGCEICEYCRAGRENLCDSKRWIRDKGEEELRIPASMVYPIPDQVSDEVAAALNFVSLAVSAVGKAKEVLGEDVLVIGDGGVSLLLVQLLKLAGAGQVFHGPESTDCRDVKYIFDCVGETGTQKKALALLKQRGTLINLVNNRTEVPIQLLDLNGEKEITSSTGSPHKDFRRALRLVASGQLQVDTIVDRKIGWEECMMEIG